jgi:hypothetical protein
VVRNRRKRGTSEILAIKDHDIEVVTSFKYLWIAINNTNDGTEEIKARILAANRACSSLQTVFVSKQFNRNNKIRLARTVLWKCNLDPYTNYRTNAAHT